MTSAGTRAATRFRRDPSARSAVGPLMALAAFTIAVAILGCSVLAPSRVVPIPADAFRPRDGHAWSVSLEPLTAAAKLRFPFEPGPTDDSAHPAIARHGLLEDGDLIAPAHAVHAEIASIGAGRHSFWGDTLVMSTSDNRDPRTDGRTHSVLLEARVAPWLSISAVLLLCAPIAWLVLRVRARSLVRAAAALLVAAPIVLLAAAWFAPRASAASDFAPPAMIAAALGGALAAMLAPRAGLGRAASLATRLHRVGLVVIERISRSAGAPWTTAVLLLALLRAWSPLERPTHQWPGVSTFSLLQGRFLASDALYGWVASQWLRWHGELPYFGARRPLLPTLLACEGVLVGGRPQGLAVCNTILMALSIFFAGRAAGRTLGAWAGLATTALLVGYAQHFVGIPMTETLGLTLGALGTALLLRGAQDNRAASIAIGSTGAFALALGLAARPGAVLVLPALLAAVAWIERRSLRRAAVAVAASALAMAGAVAVNAVVLALTSDGRGAANGNVAYVLLGLASGTDWTEGIRFCVERVPDGTEREHAAVAMAEAWRRAHAEPAQLVGALWGNFVGFVGAWGPGLSAHFGDRAGLRPWMAHTLWGGLGVAGVAMLLRRRPRVGPLVALAALGVLGSMPLIWRDGGWRALAPTFPLLAMAATSWLARPRAAAGSRRAGIDPSTAPAALLVALVATIVGGAALSALRHDAPDRPHLDATVRRYVEGDGAQPGVIRTIVLPDPRSLPSAVIERSPGFAWIGPAHVTPAELERAMGALGMPAGAWPRTTEGAAAPPRLVQYVRMDAGDGMPSGVLIDPTSLLQPRRGPTTCRVEHVGFSMWIGSIERLVRIEVDADLDRAPVR